MHGERGGGRTRREDQRKGGDAGGDMHGTREARDGGHHVYRHIEAGG